MLFFWVFLGPLAPRSPHCYPHFPVNHSQARGHPPLIFADGETEARCCKSPCPRHRNTPEHHKQDAPTLINPTREGKGCLFSFPTGKAAGAKLPLPKQDNLGGAEPRGCAGEAGFIPKMNQRLGKYLCDELPGLMPRHEAAPLPKKSHSRVSVHHSGERPDPRGGGKASGRARR